MGTKGYMAPEMAKLLNQVRLRTKLLSLTFHDTASYVASPVVSIR